MSSYVNFYLRINNNFAPIGSWSRSSQLYQHIHYNIPYEKIKPLTIEELEKIIYELDKDKQKFEKMKIEDEYRINRIMNAENTPLKDKLNAVADIESCFEDIDNTIKEYEYAIIALRIFGEMIDDFHYSSEITFDNDYNHYIYAGIEAYGRIENIVDENK